MATNKKTEMMILFALCSTPKVGLNTSELAEFTKIDRRSIKAARKKLLERSLIDVEIFYKKEAISYPSEDFRRLFFAIFKSGIIKESHIFTAASPHYSLTNSASSPVLPNGEKTPASPLAASPPLILLDKVAFLEKTSFRSINTYNYTYTYLHNYKLDPRFLASHLQNILIEILARKSPDGIVRYPRSDSTSRLVKVSSVPVSVPAAFQKSPDSEIISKPMTPVYDVGNDKKLKGKMSRSDWQQLEVCAELSVFPYYRHMDGNRRDYEWVKAYLSVEKKYKDLISRGTRSKILHAVEKNVEGEMRRTIRRGRILADSNRAFYPDWMASYWDYHLNKTKSSEKDPGYPQPKFLAGETAEFAFQRRCTEQYAKQLAFRREHLEELSLMEFFPENYTGTPEQIEFFSDLLLLVHEVSNNTGRSMQNLFDDLICTRFIFPRQFLEDQNLNTGIHYRVVRPDNDRLGLYKKWLKSKGLDL